MGQLTKAYAITISGTDMCRRETSTMTNWCMTPCGGCCSRLLCISTKGNDGVAAPTPVSRATLSLNRSGSQPCQAKRYVVRPMRRLMEIEVWQPKHRIAPLGQQLAESDRHAQPRDLFPWTLRLNLKYLVRERAGPRISQAVCFERIAGDGSWRRLHPAAGRLACWARRPKQAQRRSARATPQCQPGRREPQIRCGLFSFVPRYAGERVQRQKETRRILQ